ncbi:MAG: hypothetical protein ACHP6H_03115, partial [Legionellales bacterium]
AYEDVPAYNHHVVTYKGTLTTNWRFSDIPPTDKNNYIKPQQQDSDTHFGGKYPERNKTDTSTGTTGKPTEWVRSEAELDTVKRSLKLAAELQFGKRPLNYINAFAFGPWATGLTTYELMRETGSVFATGPDRAKILDKMINILKYETHQLDLAVEAFAANKPTLTPANKDTIAAFINTVLGGMLKDKDADFRTVWHTQLLLLTSDKQDLILKNNSELYAVAARLNAEKSQIILAGYPPFLKELTDYATQQQVEFGSFSAIAIVGGQAISEAMRDQIVRHGFKQIFSSYGASDLDINLGVESDYEISVRKAIENDPELARELYGENKGLPMVFHYDPLNYHVECDDEDNLIFTCARNDRSSPRIRYNLGDKGRIYASSDVQALLAKHGIFKKPKVNLPLMFVWGRDSTVVFVGANLAFTELERAVTTHKDLERDVLKKAFYKVDEEHIEIWLELKEGVELPTEQNQAAYSFAIWNNLVMLNQDLSYQVAKLDTNTPLPMVRFFKRGQSPISEAGGHRKQVLIFEKGVNLEKDYQLPQQDQCLGYALPKTDEVLVKQDAPSVQLV